MKKQTNKKIKRAVQPKRTRPNCSSLPKAVSSLLTTSKRNAGRSGYAKPAQEAIERYCNIPLLFEECADARSVRGRTVYDSWANGPAIALRDTTDGRIRRLKLKADNLTLEIVAEKQDNQWEFVARVYKGSGVTNSFVLKVGGHRFLPQTGGFFVWSSKIVPRMLRLESFETSINFEKLSWQ